MIVDNPCSCEAVLVSNPKSSEDLGEAFSVLLQFIRNQNLISTQINRVRTASVQDMALLLADYVANHLRSFHDEPFVATRYEPAFGHLNKNRVREEAHFHLRWEPLRERGRRTVYELNLGAHDLSFIASVLPKDQRDTLVILKRLSANQMKLTDLAWDNSVRCLGGFDFTAWKVWSRSLNALVPFALGGAPERFSVCIEAGPIKLPMNTERVAHHVSDAVRRTSNVLALL